jgi:hypothetical protein
MFDEMHNRPACLKSTKACAWAMLQDENDQHRHVLVDSHQELASCWAFVVVEAARTTELDHVTHLMNEALGPTSTRRAPRPPHKRPHHPIRVPSSIMDVFERGHALRRQYETLHTKQHVLTALSSASPGDVIQIDTDTVAKFKIDYIKRFPIPTLTKQVVVSTEYIMPETYRLVVLPAGA